MTDWDDKTELDVMSLVGELVDIEDSRGGSNGAASSAPTLASPPPPSPQSATGARARAPRASTLLGLAAPPALAAPSVPPTRRAAAVKNPDFADDEVTRVYRQEDGQQMRSSSFSAEETRLFATVDARSLSQQPPRERAAASPSALPAAPPSLGQLQAVALPARNEATREYSLKHLTESRPTSGELTASARAHSVVSTTHSRGLSARALSVVEPTIIAPATARPSFGGAQQVVAVQQLPAEGSSATPAHAVVTVAAAPATAASKAATMARYGWLLKVAVVAALVTLWAVAIKLRSGKPDAPGKDKACVALGTCSRLGGAAVVASAAAPLPVPAVSASALDPMAGPALHDATPRSASAKLAQGDLEGALRSYRTLARREPANESYRLLVSLLFARAERSVRVGEGG